MMKDLETLNGLLKEDGFVIGEILTIGESTNLFVLFKPEKAPDGGEDWKTGSEEDE
jgi:hypothetical protein